MNNSHHPPPWVDHLLEWMCAPHLLEEIQGDLHELYGKWVEKHGERKARRLYFLNAIKFFHPYAFKKVLIHNPTNMLKNYFKIAFRNLLSKKVYSAINILGLSIGMACCLLIYQYITFEYSFDTFNTNAKQLYRVALTTSRNGNTFASAMLWYQMGPALAQEVPEVVQFTRFHANSGGSLVSYSQGPTYESKVFKEERLSYVDSSFLKMFSYQLIRGNPNTALSQPNMILLSASAARKYFGSEDPTGKVLDVEGLVKGAYTVAGVFKDVPSNSHLQFDFLLPMEDLLRSERYKAARSGLDWFNFNTYVLLDPRADLEDVERKFTTVVLKQKGNDYRASNATVQVLLQPLLDIHLNGEIVSAYAVTGNAKAVYFFALIALITFVIALVNYVNLATARALGRGKEVGVRKVIGASRRQLIVQLFLESAVMMLVALVFAIGLFLELIPLVNRLLNLSLTGLWWLSSWSGATFFLLIFILGVILAGFYPAFILSSFQPVSILKGQTGAFSSRPTLRKVLVVWQFAASTVLLIGLFVVYVQVSYMQRIDTGLDLEQILVIEAPQVLEGDARESALDAFKSELRKLSTVSDITISETIPGDGFDSFTRMWRATADPSAGKDVNVTGVDPEFIEVYGLDLVAGRFFSQEMSNSIQELDESVVLNERAVKALGFAANSEALNEWIVMMGDKKKKIIGVVKDFNWSSAHYERQTVAFSYEKEGDISIKVSTENLPKTIATVEELYKQLFPGNPFQYAFADDTFEAQYQNDQRFASLFTIFAALALLIACLGLFGLAAFTAQQRTKEIGIRKVMGATVANVIALLSQDFLKLVMMGFLIAVPIAWYLMHQWLEDFAYRIKIGPGVFLLAGLAIVLIALVTVSWQSIKAALANPVDSLRNE